MKKTGEYAVTWLGRYQPIAVFTDNILIAYTSGKLYKIHSYKKECVGIIPLSKMDCVKEKIRLLQRIFRKEIKCSCIAKDRCVYFFKGKELFKFDMQNGQTVKVVTLKEGQYTPLNITASEDVRYAVIWGDYSGNTERKAVNIYGLNRNNDIEIIYTFPPKSIRHIHNIIYDKNGGYYILTGDNDERAGIYHTDNGFTKMEPIAIGKQKYRTVQGFPFRNGLLYATDSVMDVNYICYLYKNANSEWIVDEISQIEGSCIYGTQAENGFYFSTTVESPEVNDKNKIKAFCSRKRGAGILSDYSVVYHVDRDLVVRRIIEGKKDRLPYKLFEYGTVRFCPRENESDDIFIYPVAIERVDGKLGKLDRNR